MDKNSNKEADIQEEMQLARDAAEGDSIARAKINQFLHPIINFQTDRFCKRFCKENQHLYVCTLARPWGSAPPGAAFCEWGNASYGWMLEDLSNAKRLQQYQGKNGASLNNYLYHIANSLPFYERWKNWRFGRKVHVPTYIQSIGPNAAKAFFALRSGDNIALVAQKLGLSEEKTETLCQQIVITLTQKNRLHLLDPPGTVSLNDGQNEEETQLPSEQHQPEQWAQSAQLQQAWEQLSPVEQFVMESMVMDEQDANDVLLALKKLDISIKKDVLSQQTNRQHLYYFRRKTLTKLAKLMES